MASETSFDHENEISARKYLSSALLTEPDCIPPSIALSLARTGSTRNDRVALVLFARLLLDGHVVSQNASRAVRLLRRAAARPNPHPEAVELLADCYAFGVGVARNITLSNRLRRTNSHAYRDDFDMQIASRSVKKSLHTEEAFLMLQEGISTITAKLNTGASELDAADESTVVAIILAAEQELPDAMFCLARMYRAGLGVNVDASRAAELMLKLKVAGHYEALFHVAEYYEYGIGVRQSDSKAAMLYGIAARRGHPEAIVRLAGMYELGTGVLRNLDEAGRLFIRAHNVDGVLRIAHRYLSGIGERRNPPKAIALYKYAAERGDVLALFNLACIYEDGIGVRKDVAMAMRLYHQAVTADSTDAMVNLAVLYENGVCGRANYDQARLLYLKALRQSEEVSTMEALPEAKNEAEASAMYNLARIYWLGLGVAKDSPLALRLFRKAAECRSYEAKQFLTTAFQAEHIGSERCGIR